MPTCGFSVTFADLLTKSLQISVNRFFLSKSQNSEVALRFKSSLRFNVIHCKYYARLRAYLTKRVAWKEIKHDNMFGVKRWRFLKRVGLCDSFEVKGDSGPLQTLRITVNT